jgi:hypothetical protein
MHGDRVALGVDFDHSIGPMAPDSCSRTTPRPQIQHASGAGLRCGGGSVDGTGDARASARQAGCVKARDGKANASTAESNLKSPS